MESMSDDVYYNASCIRLPDRMCPKQIGIIRTLLDAGVVTKHAHMWLKRQCDVHFMMWDMDRLEGRVDARMRDMEDSINRHNNFDRPQPWYKGKDRSKDKKGKPQWTPFYGKGDCCADSRANMSD